jgi:tRNA-uridine 2-sulfurtransferase
MRVVVAMSGGVDSSVCAALLQEQGHEVIGIHMKLHDVVEGEAGHCCGLDDVLDARRVADRMGFPFYVLNLQEAFKTAVMDRFAEDYRNGLTPNPCVACNGVLKFSVLLRRALALGADALATGHYARTENGRLFMAADQDKDQTYFLFPVKPEALQRTLFPLGGMTKAQVRAEARRLGLVTAEKPESMEVCFLPDDDHTRFVREKSPDLEAAGEIVDEQGKVLGHHDGYYRFTVGQRRGLNVAMGERWYVLSVDAARRRVVVGPPERLLSTTLEARGFAWIRRPEVGEVLMARIRHRGALIPCTVRSEEPFLLDFQAPARAAAPGQAVVIYAGDEVLGGGYIVAPKKVSDSAEMRL